MGGFGRASGELAPSPDLEASAGLLLPPSFCFCTNKLFLFLLIFSMDCGVREKESEWKI